jgi:putative superfamily III holin-X
MASIDESIPDLIRGTIRDAISLVRDEIFLARSELREEMVRIKGGLITVAGAAVAGILAVVMLLDAVAWAVVYAFDWPTWAGFGLVALPLALIAVVLAMLARSLLSRDRYMPKSVDTLKENVEWIRGRTQS